MPTKIAILGASDFQNPLIEKANSLGLETHVFAWAANDIGERTASCFHPVSIAETEEILKICKEEGVSGITTCGSDFAVVAQNAVAEALGLPGNGTATTLPCTNKYAMRQALRAAGLPVPKFAKVQSPDQQLPADFAYPLIVKPTDRSGSRAIARIDDPAQLPAALARAIGTSFSREAIAEEFIQGPEYSAEGITYRGRHHILAITKKYTTGAPHFIETGHDQPAPDLGPEQTENIRAQIARALTALRITNSASHAEFRLQPDGTIRIIEIGARMGGDCIGSHLVQLSTGIDFLRATIQVALGQEPDLSPAHAPQSARIRFFMTRQEAAAFDPAATPHLVHHTIDTHNQSDSVTDSSTRFGYYITAQNE